MPTVTPVTAVTAVTGAVHSSTDGRTYARPGGSERGDTRVANRSKVFNGLEPPLPGSRSPRRQAPGPTLAAAWRLDNKVSDSLCRAPPPGPTYLCRGARSLFNLHSRCFGRRVKSYCAFPFPPLPSINLSLVAWGGDGGRGVGAIAWTFGLIANHVLSF